MIKSEVTIIIPVFERVHFFKESLSSALNQTLQSNIIVIDNGSSHNEFKEICDFYNSKIQYIKNRKNIGMYPNWNKGIKNCNTKYFIILGDDDILDLDYIEKFHEILSKYKEIDLYYTDFYFYFNDDNKLLESNWKIFKGYGKGLDFLKDNKKKELNYPTISTIIKTNLFENNTFYEGFHASNDWEWVYRNIKNLKIYGNKEKKMKYRKHKASDTFKDETILNTKYSQIAIRTYLFKIKTNNFIDLKFYIKSYVRALNFFLRNDSFLNIEKKNEKYYYEIIKKYYLDRLEFRFLMNFKFIKKIIKQIKSGVS